MPAMRWRSRCWTSLNSMNTSRDDVYDAIDSERAYQEKLAEVRGWQESQRVPAQSVGDFLTLLSTYTRRAQDDWTDHCGHQEALHQVRKIAAIAVRCMEEHGAPCRIPK